MNRNITYGFKDFTINGLGADLIRISKLYYWCRLKNIKLWLLGSPDQWGLVSKKSNQRNWLRYFEESLPIDNEGHYQKVNENILRESSKLDPHDYHANPFPEFSAILKKIYKPNQEMLERRDKILSKFSFLNNENYVAIHIRRGDKTSGPWKEGTAIEISKYLRALYNNMIKMDISEREKIKYLYLATDSEEVIEDIKGNMLPFGLTLIYDNQEVRRDGFVYKIHKGVISDEVNLDEIVTFMKNIHNLANSKLLIGSRMSFFFIVAELLRGREGISLSDNLYYPVKFYSLPQVL